VDGFDELLGVTGYDDAFASLSRFLDELHGAGEIVAAARSAYYEQEFLSRAKLVDQPWELLPIGVLPWNEQEFGHYVEQRHSREHDPSLDKATFRRRMNEVFQPPMNRDLRSKPFFVAKAAELVFREQEIDLTVGLIDHLVRSYIERDRTEKLVDPSGTPMLSKAQIRDLFVLLAEEMWLQETRELDLVSVRGAADVLLELETIDGTRRDRVIQRIPFSAFLKPGKTANRVEFEHETFLSYFLADSLAPTLKRGPDASRSALMRGILPPKCPDFAIDRLREDGLGLGELIAVLNASAETKLRKNEQIRENAGALAAAALRGRLAAAKGAPVDFLRIVGLSFAGESFENVAVEGIRFESVEFKRVDFSGARFTQGKAVECLFYEVTIDLQSTLLELSGIDPSTDVVGLFVRDQGQRQGPVYEGGEVRCLMARVGVPVSNDALPVHDVDPELLELLNRVMGAFDRTNVIWTSDDKHRRLVSHKDWGGLKRQLLRKGIVEPEDRPNKGQRREALRLKYSPQEILAGINPGIDSPEPVRELWLALEEHFPAPVSN
jgi:hypothetical protein